MKLVYPAILHPFSDGTEGYTVLVPDLPGCVTEGGSMAEAILNGIDAAAGWILGEWEDGLEVPSAQNQNDILCEDGDVITLLPLDMDSYAEKYGKKAVRKNLTIPAYLNTYAEAHGINFSQLLQEALVAQMQTKKEKA